jgi:uncharacterized protein YceK
VTHRPLWMASVAAGILLVSGCGTLCNTVWWIPEEGGERIYGGVQMDVGVLRESLSVRSEDRGIGDRLLGVAFFTLDLPFSAIGDTLTLPILIPRALGWTREPELRNETTTPAGASMPDSGSRLAGN